MIIKTVAIAIAGLLLATSSPRLRSRSMGPLSSADTRASWRRGRARRGTASPLSVARCWSGRFASA